MSTDRDTTRVVRSWLRTDEHESAARVLDNVLGLLDTTPQHRSSWPVRRISTLNTYAKLAIAAAAIVAVAVIGTSVLPSSGSNVGGAGGTPSPSVTPSVTPPATPTRSPTPTPEPNFPSPGPLAVGRHRAVVEGVPLSFSITQTGWSASPYSEVGKGAYQEPDGASLVFWIADPDNVYSDPCAHTPLSPAPTHTAVALAAAVSTLPGTVLVSGPTTATIDGHPSQHVVIRIRNDIGCQPSDFYRWYDDDTGGPTGGYRNGADLDATISVWIIDVDGKLVWIDGETFKGAKAALTQELERIVESITFE